MSVYQPGLPFDLLVERALRSLRNADRHFARQLSAYETCRAEECAGADTPCPAICTHHHLSTFASSDRRC